MITLSQTSFILSFDSGHRTRLQPLFIRITNAAAQRRPGESPIIRGRIRRIEPRAGRQRVRDLASPEEEAFLKRPTERTLRFLRAAEQGRLDVAKLLLAGGADVRAKGHSGESGCTARPVMDRRKW